MRPSTPWLLLAALSLTPACGDKDGGADSGGASSDGGGSDGGGTDSGSTDGGGSDGGGSDGGGTDGGGTDGGGTDGGGTDSGSTTDVDADGDGWTVGDGDCDDDNGDVHPDAVEICNGGIDDDCSGTADDADAGLDTSTATSWWIDADADGWGGNTGYIRCENPGTDTTPYVTTLGDCDDGDDAVHPAATEICNDGIDDDCDGYVDDEDEDLDTATATTLWWDMDEDGFGDPDASFLGCAAGYAQADNDGDCDDTDGAVFPGATEVCNDGVDDDCDGTADDADDDLDDSTTLTWHLDADGDGFGGDDSVDACAAPAHYVDDATDCDDSDLTVFPGATEICNGGIDDDCDGTADDADEDLDEETTSAWYTDGDGDGYGNGWVTSACAGPDGTADADGDCDDEDDSVFPGATEQCDGLDQDCDGVEDASDAAGFTDDGGDWTDLTATLSGSSSSTGAWASTEAGTLHLCDGTFHATLDLGHDVHVQGYGDAVVDGDSSGTVVVVDGSGLTVSIEEITVTGGNGDSALLSITGGAGGGLACADGDSLVRLDGVRLEDNVASYGGALAVGDCIVEVDNSVLVDNSAYNGGAIYQRGGMVILADSTVEDNTATNLGGGGVVVHDALVAATPYMELSTTYFLDNSAGGAGALYLGDRTEAWCGGGSTGFWGNETTGSGYGAVETYGDTHFQADDCDFGASGTDDDNGDVDVEAAGSGYSFSDGATFHCHEETCI